MIRLHDRFVENSVGPPELMIALHALADRRRAAPIVATAILLLAAPLVAVCGRASAYEAGDLAGLTTWERKEFDGPVSIEYPTALVAQNDDSAGKATEVPVAQALSTQSKHSIG